MSRRSSYRQERRGARGRVARRGRTRGARRRAPPRAEAGLALVALLLAPAAVGGALWLALREDPALPAPLAVASAADAASEEGPTPDLVSEEPVREEPVPDDEAIPDREPTPEHPTPSREPQAGSFRPRSPAPIRLAGAAAFDVRLRKPPGAALVLDVGSGRVLYRRRPLRVLPIASLTKIMTALAVTTATRPGEAVRVPHDLTYEGSAVGLLPKGRRVRLEPLLAGLLIVSGNDAAIALAEHVSGSEPRFVASMNERARRWGLTCTRFVSPHGLESGNRSCAADLAVLTRLALRRRRIASLARRAQVSYRFPIEGRRLHLSGHNPLIRSGYRGAIGLKTGYTHEAGRCFVGVARRDGRTLAVVLLDSFDPGRQAAKLLNRAFAAG